VRQALGDNYDELVDTWKSWERWEGFPEGGDA